MMYIYYDIKIRFVGHILYVCLHYFPRFVA